MYSLYIAVVKGVHVTGIGGGPAAPVSGDLSTEVSSRPLYVNSTVNALERLAERLLAGTASTG